MALLPLQLHYGFILCPWQLHGRVAIVAAWHCYHMAVLFFSWQLHDITAWAFIPGWLDFIVSMTAVWHDCPSIMCIMLFPYGCVLFFMTASWHDCHCRCVTLLTYGCTMGLPWQLMTLLLVWLHDIVTRTVAGLLCIASLSWLGIITMIPAGHDRPP